MRNVARNRFLLLGALLAVAGCSVTNDQENCESGKCDGWGGGDGANTVMQQLPTKSGEFSITRDTDDLWAFEAIGERGEIVLFSQDYLERVSALNGILSVEENGVLKERYRVVQNSQGWGFELRAANNQVIATSQTFETEEEALAGTVEARDLIASILQFKAAVDRGAKFDLWRDGGDGQWHFDLLAADQSVLLNSEAYTRRSGALNGIESVRENGKNELRYELLQDGVKHFFILKAANGQEIASSPSFVSPEAAQAGIKSIQALLVSERVGNPW